MSALETTVAAISDRIRKHGSSVQTEEAVKTSFVLPFLQALGYDVFNPSEVVPEFTADTPGKKGEKVDYAIVREGEVAVLVECKGLSTPLNDKHLAQLYRYFSVTNARFAVLTNGREYRFYTDLDEPNKMDKRPFFSFDVTDHSNAALGELEKFGKSAFDVENILNDAERLKYVGLVRKWLEGEMESPSDELARLAAKSVMEGSVTASVRVQMARALRSAFQELVRERVRARLSSALDNEPEREIEAEVPEIETTEDEIQGFVMLKALLRGSVDLDRIVMRDARSYCAILLDNNNRKPIARFHFNGKVKRIGLFDGDGEDRIDLNSLDDIIGFQERLVGAVRKYNQD